MSALVRSEPTALSPLCLRVLYLWIIHSRSPVRRPPLTLVNQPLLPSLSHPLLTPPERPWKHCFFQNNQAPLAILISEVGRLTPLISEVGRLETPDYRDSSHNLRSRETRVNGCFLLGVRLLLGGGDGPPMGGRWAVDGCRDGVAGGRGWLAHARRGRLTGVRRERVTGVRRGRLTSGRRGP